MTHTSGTIPFVASATITPTPFTTFEYTSLAQLHIHTHTHTPGRAQRLEILDTIRLSEEATQVRLRLVYSVSTSSSTAIQPVAVPPLQQPLLTTATPLH